VTKSTKLLELLPQVIGIPEDPRLTEEEREAKKICDSLKAYVFESLMTIVSEGALDFD
jgi:hypothetical protein